MPAVVLRISRRPRTRITAAAAGAAKRTRGAGGGPAHGYGAQCCDGFCSGTTDDDRRADGYPAARAQETAPVTPTAPDLGSASGDASAIPAGTGGLGGLGDLGGGSGGLGGLGGLASRIVDAMASLLGSAGDQLGDPSTLDDSLDGKDPFDEGSSDDDPTIRQTTRMTLPTTRATKRTPSKPPSPKAPEEVQPVDASPPADAPPLPVRPGHRRRRASCRSRAGRRRPRRTGPARPTGQRRVRLPQTSFRRRGSDGLRPAAARAPPRRSAWLRRRRSPRGSPTAWSRRPRRTRPGVRR